MALSKSTITGRVPLPTDENLQFAELTFALSGLDTEGASVLPGGISKRVVLIDSDLPPGFELWQNVAGLRGTHYRVLARWTVKDRDGVREQYADLGVIQIGSNPSYTLADLINNGVPPAIGTFWSAITQAQYDAVIQAAADAQASAVAAALYDGPRFGTIALMQAGTGFADGKFVRVDAGANGEQEGFVYDAASTLTADGALIVDATGMGVGRLISTRSVYADWAEMDADVRTLPNGTDLTVNGVGEFVTVGTGEDLTLTGGLKVTIRPDGDGAIPAGAVGCDMGTADNSAALAKLYAINPKAVSFDKFYPVTGNFARADIPHYGVGGVTVGVVNVPLNTVQTFAPVSVYVATTGSDTANHGLSAAYPFATPQRAFDSLSASIGHQQTINLQDGVYNTSSRLAISMPRPAIFYPQGKNIARRTAQSGTDLIGMVVLRGESEAGTIIESAPASGYTYGFYVSGVEIAMQKLTLRGGAGTTNAILTSHRGAYVHAKACTINAAGVGLGSVCEAGGILESIDCDHVGATSYDITAYSNSFAQAANPAGGRSVGKVLVSGGTIDIAIGASLTGNSLAAGGGKLTLTGGVSNRVTVSGDITTDPGCFFGGTYADIGGNMVLRGSSQRLSGCGWSKTATVYGGELRVDGSKSYISPATQSTVATPIIAREGATIIVDVTTEIRNSSGALCGPDYGRQQISVPSNGYALPIALQGQNTVVNVYGSAANRTGATIAAPSGLLAGTPPPDGALLHFVCQSRSTYSVEIIEGSTAIIPGGAIVIGGFAGNFSGCSFVYSELIDKWILLNVGKAF